MSTPRTAATPTAAGAGRSVAPAARPVAETGRNPLWDRLATSAGSGAGGEPAPQPWNVLARHAVPGGAEHAGTVAAAPPTVPAAVGQVLRGPGRALDASTRAAHAPYFGELADVRIHTGADAAASARAVAARAYTVGRDVVFGAGEYAPGSAAGRALLAHELAHVAQQRAAPAALARSATLAVSRPDDPLEREADAAAAACVSSAPPVPLSAGAGGRAQRLLLREAITLRSTHDVTDTTPGAADNRREEVLDLLDRLHTLWSIDNARYSDQYRYISALPAGAQVPQSDASTQPPWSFQPTMDAIRRNRGPTLAAAVINHHMGGLAVSDSVGRGLTNNKADVLAVQDRLNFLAPYPAYVAERAAVVALSTPTVPDSALGGTYGAITDFKIGIASGEAGWLTVRASESEYGGDRFAGQTASHTVTVLANHTASEGAVFETREAIQVAIFLPSGLTPEQNKVFLFFSPGDGTEVSPTAPGGNATNVHAIRSGADASGWIVIGIPGFRAASAERGWNSFDTAAIQSCLTRAGRGTRIDALRLAAHSRGGRGLTRTVARRLIDVGLIDRVIMLDQPHPGLAGSLAAGAARGARPAPITDYTQGGGGGAGTALDAQGVRAIGFARLVQDRSDLPPPAAAATLLAPVLVDLPSRGRFTTHPVAAGTTGGRINIHDWIRSHSTAIGAIARADARAQTEWTRFVGAPTSTLDRSKVDPSPWFHVNTQNLMRFFSGPLIDAAGRPVAFGFTLGIYAHHLFVAEIAEELFE